MNAIFEKKKLLKLLGKSEVGLLTKYNLIVGGGAITSIFTNGEINDFDIYARTEEDLLGFVQDLTDDGYNVMSSTDKSTLMVNGETLIQAIHFKYFENTDEIFNSFDFTSVMGAYDFKYERFFLHEDFMKHNAQRILKFNPNTDYPLVSALRVHKYEGKGFKISKAEYLRIIMACMKLEIKSYKELREQLSGMYGVDLDKLFEDIEGEEFDMSKAIEKLGSITLSDEYFEKPKVEFEYDIDKVLMNISKKAIKYVEFKGNTYRIHNNGTIEKVSNKVEHHEMVNIKDLFPENKLYKFVKKNEDETYSSYYDSKFIYKIGEIAEATGSVGTGHCDNGKLHFNSKDKIKRSTYYGNADKVLLEVIFNHDNLIDINSSPKVTARKVYVNREVPEAEWKEWVGENEKPIPAKINILAQKGNYSEGLFD